MVGNDRRLAGTPHWVWILLLSAVTVGAGARLPSTGAGVCDVAGAALVVALAARSLLPASAGSGSGSGSGPGSVAMAPAAVVAMGAVWAGLAGHLAHRPVAVVLAVVAAVLALAAMAWAPGRAVPAAVPALAGGAAFGAAVLVTGRGLAPAAGWACLLAVAGLPLAGSVVGGLSRVRHPGGGGLGLAGRLAAGGGSGRAGAVTAVGVVVEAGLGVLGAAVAGGHVAPGPAAALSAVVVAGVTAVALAAPAGRAVVAGGRFPRWFAWSGGALVVLLGAGVVPAALSAVSARGPALAGEHAARAGLAAGRAGHLRVAAADFATARREFASARGDLAGPWVSLGLAYPVVAPNLRAVRVLAGIGTSLAAQGRELSLAGDRFRYGIHGGTVPVADLAATAPRFQSARVAVDRAGARLAALDPPFLLSPVTGALAELERQLATARRDVDQADGIATYVPDLLGLHGPRRYFVAFETDAEQRATGGLIGLDGVLTATDGHLSLSGLQSSTALNNHGPAVRTLHAPPGYLARYGAYDPADNWEMVNLSPDFPTVGAVIAGLYPQSGGVPVDGVLAVDPAGLAAVMELTGPVTVPGWPVPVTPANVVAVTQNQAYVAYAGRDAARQAFLEDLVHTVFARISTLDLHDPVTLVDDLAPAVRAGHLMTYATRPAEQAYLASLHLTGAVPPVVSDAFELTTQNAAANKIDYYLTRTVDYRIRLRPLAGAGGAGAPTRAAATGSVTVTLHNGAPLGLPPIVDGPGFPGMVAGENRTFVTLYTPLQFSRPTLNGAPTGLEPERELGRWADATFVDVAAGQTATLATHLSGTLHLAAGGWYELSLPHQPVINPDRVTVTVTVAPGWRVVAARGARVVGSTTASTTMEVTAPRTVWVQVAPDGG